MPEALRKLGSDLSGGASAASYPVSYVSSVPSGGFNTDEYKTTKLVMRRIAPGAIPTRDGGWCNDAYDCTSSYRYYDYPENGKYGRNGFGFRLVRTLSEDVAGTYTIKFHRYDASDEKTEAYDFDYRVNTRLPTLNSMGWARRGFDFKGWATSQANAAAGKVWKTDGAWVKDATAEGKTLSIYAIWK